MCRHLCSRCHVLAVLQHSQKVVMYSRAQRYGSNAKIFGRAHFDKSNADFLEAILGVCCVEEEVEFRLAVHSTQARGTFL